MSEQNVGINNWRIYLCRINNSRMWRVIINNQIECTGNKVRILLSDAIRPAGIGQQ